MDSIRLRQMIGAQLVRAGQVIQGNTRRQFVNHCLGFNNPFTVQLVRRMGVGMKPRVVFQTQGHNDVTIVGKNHMLDVTFGNTSPVTQVATWYIGLINNSPTPVFVEGDTLASHAGWAETTAYTGNRQAWVDANAASKIKGTTTVSTFPITGTVDVNGIFVCSVATTTSGLLWATGSFDDVVPAVAADDVKVTYGVRM